MFEDEVLKLVHKNAWGIRFYRLGQGRTQSQVADAAVISLRNYQRIESGEVVPKVTTLFQILTALNVSVTEFFSSFPSEAKQDVASGVSPYKLEDLELIYKTLCQENMVHGKMQLEKLQRYIAKGDYGLERENSVFTSTIEGIDTNDVSKKIFNQEKLKYNYNEFSDMTIAHSVISTILNTQEEGSLYTLKYPVNFDGTPVTANVYGCLVKKNWDNPLLLGISEVAENENQLLGIIHTVRRERHEKESAI